MPIIGLPGNPRSALVVFRLIGMPLVRLVAGCTLQPAEATVRARLDRDLASATGRLDVLSVLTTADGYVIIPEEATGLAAGTKVDVTLYR